MKNRVRAIIRKGDKLLLVRHKSSDHWCLPGGGLEKGEGLKDALKRELNEELGVVADIGELLAVHQFRYKGEYQGPEFFFEVKNVTDFNKIDLMKTSHGVSEIESVEFMEPQLVRGLKPEFLKSTNFRKGVEVVLE